MTKSLSSISSRFRDIGLWAY